MTTAKQVRAGVYLLCTVYTVQHIYLYIYLYMYMRQFSLKRGHGLWCFYRMRARVSLFFPNDICVRLFRVSSLISWELLPLVEHEMDKVKTKGARKKEREREGMRKNAYTHVRIHVLDERSERERERIGEVSQPLLMYSTLVTTKRPCWRVRRHCFFYTH